MVFEQKLPTKSNLAADLWRKISRIPWGILLCHSWGEWGDFGRDGISLGLASRGDTAKYQAHSHTRIMGKGRNRILQVSGEIIKRKKSPWCRRLYLPFICGTRRPVQELSPTKFEKTKGSPAASEGSWF